MPSRARNGGLNYRPPKNIRPQIGQQAIGYAGTRNPGGMNRGLSAANNLEHGIGTAAALNNAARANGTYGPGNRAYVHVSSGGAVTVRFS